MRPLATATTSAHLLVCVGPTCSSKGSRDLFGALWQTMERESLAYYTSGGSVRLTAADCLGACEQGPTVACYRATDKGHEPTWYGAVTIESAQTFVRNLNAAGVANAEA